MRADNRHQCRYCDHCVVTADDIPICEHKEVNNQEHGYHIPYKFNRPNRCPFWLFNEIAADFWGDESKVYRPRKPSPFKQPRLFEMKTDKQKLKEGNRNG